MKEELRTIGYLCPACHKRVIQQRSVFALSASGAVVSCECGESSLTIEAEENKFRLSVPCGVCGEAITRPPVYFSVRAGTAADEKCARRVGGYAQLGDSALRAIVHALSAEPNRVYAFALGGAAKEQFCAMAEEYVKFHLGRGFESLRFYRSLQEPMVNQ